MVKLEDYLPEDGVPQEVEDAGQKKDLEGRKKKS